MPLEAPYALQKSLTVVDISDSQNLARAHRLSATC